MAAILCGLNLAANLGCAKLAIESNSINGLEAIFDPNTHMGTDVPIIVECSLLTLEFASITFDHCSREANMVVDGDNCIYHPYICWLGPKRSSYSGSASVRSSYLKICCVYNPQTWESSPELHRHVHIVYSKNNSLSV